eukprot:scaffold657_cov214-Amphora_coffeaeformis.AAC.4
MMVFPVVKNASKAFTAGLGISRSYDHVISPCVMDGAFRFFFTSQFGREARISDWKKAAAALADVNVTRMADRHRTEVPGEGLNDSPFKFLCPIDSKELKMDQVHWDCVFCCTIVTPCMNLASAQMLVEDSQKELVELSVYNVHGDPNKYFYEGRRIAIVEPYFKMRMDLTPGIRVDNPAIEVYLDWIDDDLKRFKD